jgi:2-dehydro-3-deoxygluconokinase
VRDVPAWHPCTGGSPANVAVGLARLGLKVAWLSRLTNNALGRLIEQTIRGYGVDTSQVVWTERDRVGIYYLEEGKAPRGNSVIYDRANTAISRMQPEELPAALFQPDNARLLHLTGITPALGPEVAATAWRMVELAKAAGWKFVFDMYYRARLWSPAQALQGCDRFARAADLFISPLGDARLIYELPASLTPQQSLEILAERYPQATVVLTLGKEGAIGREPNGEIIAQPVFAAEEVGRLGGGDAFAAGLLYGYLLQKEQPGWLALALRWGAATAALKYSLPGDMPLINRAEVEGLVAQTDTAPTRLWR